MLGITIYSSLTTCYYNFNKAISIITEEIKKNTYIAFSNNVYSSFMG